MVRTTVPRGVGDARTRRFHPTAEDLAVLLADAAGGDVAAFMRFYDLTCAAAYRAALAVCTEPACAEELTCSLYERAWAEASAYSQSGLSPMAWLLAAITRSDLSGLPAHGAATTLARGA